jgi:3-phosphoshikimate 1-carboxyvinyltransferase
VLLAGLNAVGETVVRETTPTRAHTEEMLAASGADITVEPGLVRLKASVLNPFDLHVPGDPSQAAFWVVGACIVPGSDLVVERIYLGPARAAFLEVLRRMGADITLEDHDVEAQVASVRVRYHPLVATEVGGAEVPGLIDEIPALAVAAAVASGTTAFSGASELRVKESDRIASVVAGLQALGVAVEPAADGLVVPGSAGRPLQPGRADAHGDHRIAMALAVAALTADGPTTITGWESVATSYPGFGEDLLGCAS